MHRVILEGIIDAKNVARIKTALDVIKNLNFFSREKEIVFCINSVGGYVAPAIDLIDFIKKMELEGFCIHVKITFAKSVAVVVALSVGADTAMKMNTSLHFHRGSLQLEASDFDETGQISESIMDQFREYSSLLNEILAKYKILDNPQKKAKLYGSGCLEVSDNECLKLGIINERFS